MLSTSAGSLQDLHNSYSFMENLPNPRKATNMYTVNIWRLRADLRVRNNKPDVLEIVKNDIFSQQGILYNTFVLCLPWIIERLDRKLADAVGSNIVEKCDITLSRAIQPHSTFCASYFPRIFHYLCLRRYIWAMFWSKGWRGLALGEDS